VASVSMRLAHANETRGEHRDRPPTRGLAPVKKSIYSLIDLRDVLLFLAQAASGAFVAETGKPSIPSSSYRRCQVRTVSSSISRTLATAV